MKIQIFRVRVNPGGVTAGNCGLFRRKPNGQASAAGAGGCMPC
jgi:hypothetical protein